MAPNLGNHPGRSGAIHSNVSIRAVEALEGAFSAAFPNHRMLAGFLVEDSCGFLPTTCGKAYYDLVTIENRTLEIWQDTVKK